MRATTAVILARGLGTRMRAADQTLQASDLTAAQLAAAEAGAKGLMPIAGAPLLDHSLHALADGGVRQVVIVVAPDDVSIRARYTTERPPSRLRVRFAVQTEPLGTADALLAAREAVTAIARENDPLAAGGDFLMLNADNIYPADSVAALVALDGPGSIAFEATALSEQGNIEPARVMQFALLDVSTEGTLREIVEKPEVSHPLARAAERWVSMNLWRFPMSIFDDCAAVSVSVRGELELVDAVRGAMARGVRFQAIRQRLGVLDLSRRSDVAVVERVLGGRTAAP